MSAEKARAKVIFVNRFFFPDHSATSQLMSDLAFELAGAGSEVLVVTSRQQYDAPAARLPVHEHVRGVEVRRVETTGFGRATIAGRAVDLASFYATAFLTVMRLAQRGDVIVAKTDPPLLSVVAHVLSRLTGARFVNWLQDVYPEVAGALGVRAARGPLGRGLVALRNASLRAAQMNVVLGERMAAHIRAQGVVADKIAIIPNWSDEREIVPVPHEANELRAAWGLNGKFVVGYSGNLGRAHEWDTMFRAAKALKGDPRIVFLMIGGGHHAAGLQAQAANAGLNNIVFQPYQPASRLAESLSAADLHWISLRPELEGLIVPSKAYGILAAGRPILAVTEPNGEVARIVARHACGAQVTPGDAEGFASIVRDLADNPLKARALGLAARCAAEASCSRQNALAQWSAVIAAASNKSAVHTQVPLRLVETPVAADSRISSHGG